MSKRDRRLVTDSKSLRLTVDAPKPFIEIVEEGEMILKDRWWITLEPYKFTREESDGYFVSVLEKHYCEAHRFYHTLHHIKHCFKVLDSLKLSESLPAVEFALWFHDLVYDPTKKDNEMRSAVEFAAFALPADMPKDLIAEVCWLIAMTKHNFTPSTDAEKLLVGIDLSILGEDPKLFEEYDTQIRQEYSHVPEDLYKMGRTTILRSFLDRKTIFEAPALSHLETQARINLQATIDKLGTP